jgi:hypothetical protein
LFEAVEDFGTSFGSLDELLWEVLG